MLPFGRVIIAKAEYTPMSSVIIAVIFVAFRFASIVLLGIIVILVIDGAFMSSTIIVAVALPIFGE